MSTEILIFEKREYSELNSIIFYISVNILRGDISLNVMNKMFISYLINICHLYLTLVNFAFRVYNCYYIYVDIIVYIYITLI